METQAESQQLLYHMMSSTMIAFIRSYAEVHAIPLLGQIPGLKEYEKTKLLPCNTSKRQLYLEYAESCTAMSVRACAETHFWSCGVAIYLTYIEGSQ